MDDLAAVIDSFAGLNVLVLGDAMLDSFLEGTTSRLCQEAPAPIVTLNRRSDLPGGAANTAVNVRALGARVHFLTTVGADADGNLLLRCLREKGISTAGVARCAGRRTLAKQRVVAGSQILLRVDQGTTNDIDPATERLLLDRLHDLYPRCQAVIVSDYHYGAITPAVVRALAELQARWGPALVVDSRRLATFRAVRPTAVKPNYEEAAALLGAGPLPAGQLRTDAIAEHAEQLLDVCGSRIVAVTLDREGAVVLERERPPYRTYASAMRKACVTGAGDTFTCSLALALAAGARTATAAELASAAAAVVVGKERTASCSAGELSEFVAAGGKYVPELQRLASRLDLYRAQGRRIVFTNGCFDILHRGHITYLHQARTLGDMLVVGVNSDDSIHRLKGPSRPINTLDDRIHVLAALSCIDLLIAFDDDTPHRLIRALKPDVFVKGGDYTRQSLPEAALVEELGGVVQILPYMEARSTTSLIERIQGQSAVVGTPDCCAAVRR